jgi:hypothetical protein
MLSLKVVKSAEKDENEATARNDAKSVEAIFMLFPKRVEKKNDALLSHQNIFLIELIN